MCWYIQIPPIFTAGSELHNSGYNVAYDYANSKVQHRVLILAILCDGKEFDFLVYGSGIKSVYSLGTVTGLVDRAGGSNLSPPSLK